MAKVKLEALDIEVNLGIFQRFHDDGFVDSMLGHHLYLKDKYSRDPYDRKELGHDEFFDRYFYGYSHILGLAASFNQKIGTLKIHHIHIFYMHYRNTLRDLFTRAHEEAHALIRFNKFLPLGEEIKNEYDFRSEYEGSSINKDSFLAGRVENKFQNELLADLSATYALLKKGISLEEIKEKISAITNCYLIKGNNGKKETILFKQDSKKFIYRYN